MKLKANDTLFISALGPDNLAPGEEFEVSDDFGKDLVKRGLAKEVGGSKSADAKAKDEPEPKAAPAPLNKMDAPPDNKGIIGGLLGGKGK